MLPFLTQIRRGLAALVAGLCLATPATLAGQDPFPRVSEADRTLAQYLLRFTTQAPGVLTDVGASWQRKVYEREDSEFCNAVGPVVIVSCLNNPNSPEVYEANLEVRGAQSSVAGEVIDVAVETTPMFGVNRPTEGSAAAKGATEMGANKLEVRAQGGFEREVQFFNSTDPNDGTSSLSEHLRTGAGAQSSWWTRFTPDFTGSMTFGLSTFRHGSDAGLSGGSIAERQMTTRFGVFDLAAQQCYASDFWYNLDPTCASPRDRGAAWVGGRQRDDVFAYGSSPFTVTIDVIAGRTYSMAMNLFLYVSYSGVLDYFGTSRLDFIEIPEGGTLDLAAGSFAIRTAGAGAPGGGAGGGGPVTEVPEPSAWLLVLTGIAGLLIAGWRRHRGADSAGRFGASGAAARE